MHFRVIFLLLSLCISGCLCEWHLVWSDEFDGSHLNESNWNYAVGCNGWGNKELECYTAGRNENVRVENGLLVIKVQVEEHEGHHFTSARLNSSHAWTYGKFEARARMASGHQLWPAIWMMPQNDTYGGWAASGEIDIMELRGDDTHSFSSTIHFGGSWPNNIAHGSGFKTFAPDLSKDFHTYGIEWDKDHFGWFFDGEMYHYEWINKDMWSGRGTFNPYTKFGQPFDQPFHWILNVAVGGTFFENQPDITPEEARKWLKPTLEFDYVRVYEQRP